MDNYLIVGLGNPGQQYDNTRHQIGAMLLDYFCITNDLSFSFNHKFNAQVAELKIHSATVYLVKPQTFMNLSGDCVFKMVHYYKIKLNNVLVVQDDISLDVGRFKLKTNSSSGGHNGIRDIIAKLGTQDIRRLKIGVGNVNIMRNTTIKDFVLSRFSSIELKEIHSLYSILVQIIIDFCYQDFTILSSKYNKK